MTLLSGSTGIGALTTFARVAVALNALSGVALLILLITMFSLVSRERARVILEEITSSFRQITHSVERGLAHFLIAALGRPDASQEITRAFSTIPSFPQLTLHEQAAAHAAYRIHEVLVGLAAAQRLDDVAKVAAAAAILEPEQLVAVCPDPLDPLANTPDSILGRLTSLP
jgi:hypothetical protein